MKGLMVLPLMFVMTGIVVGQQNESSQYGTSASTSNAQSAQNFGPTEDDKIKPYKLSFTDEDILGFRSKPWPLAAAIEPIDQITGKPLPPSVVSEITLVHAKNIGNELLPTRILNGKELGNGLVQFRLTDTDLANLEREKFVYEIRPIDRGRFTKVEFYYDPPSSQASFETGPNGQPGNSFTPTTAEGFGGASKFPATKFGGNDPNDSNASFMPMPGPAPGDDDFMGPVAPIRNQFTAIEQTPAWNPAPNSQSNPNFNPSRDQLTRFPAQESGTGGATAVDWQEIRRREHQLDLQRKRDEADRLALASQQDELRREAQFRAYQQQEAQRRERAAALSPIRTNNESLDRWAGRNQPTQNQSLANGNPFSNLTADQQDALREILDEVKQLDDKSAELTERERKLALRELAVKQAEFERVMLDEFRTNSARDVSPIRSDIGLVAGGQYQNSYRPDRGDRYASADSNMGSQLQPPPKRQLGTSANGPTIRDFKAGIPGADDVTAVNSKTGIGTNRSANTQTGKAEGVIYFLLLCSLGLNVYLALISRTFYVRYNELADELRETFTATM